MKKTHGGHIIAYLRLVRIAKMSADSDKVHGINLCSLKKERVYLNVDTPFSHIPKILSRYAEIWNLT